MMKKLLAIFLIISITTSIFSEKTEKKHGKLIYKKGFTKIEKEELVYNGKRLNGVGFVDENNNYSYFIPFVILGILAFLVFRLKKQSMNSL